MDQAVTLLNELKGVVTSSIEFYNFRRLSDTSFDHKYYIKEAVFDSTSSVDFLKKIISTRYHLT